MRVRERKRELEREMVADTVDEHENEIANKETAEVKEIEGKSRTGTGGGEEKETK